MSSLSTKTTTTLGLTATKLAEIETRRLRAKEIREEKERKRKIDVVESRKNVNLAECREKTLEQESKRESGNDSSSSSSSSDSETSENESNNPPRKKSSHVTRAKVLNHYCVPASSLPLIPHVVKPNPSNKKFAPMKLYEKKIVKEKSYKKWGGKEGAKNERRRRREEGFERKREQVEGVLGGSKKPRKMLEKRLPK